MLIDLHELQKNIIAAGVCTGDCFLCGQPGSREGEKVTKNNIQPRPHFLQLTITSYISRIYQANTTTGGPGADFMSLWQPLHIKTTAPSCNIILKQSKETEMLPF